MISTVLYDPESNPNERVNNNMPIETENNDKKSLTYSWNMTTKKEEEVSRETFSPTILEYIIRDMNVSSCHPEILFSLKDVEPLLHQTFQPLIPYSQILSLLTVTMNKRYMDDIKRRVLHLQRYQILMIII